MFNIDQVDRPGQEEFIWAMRTVIDSSADNEEWRERRLKTQHYSGPRITNSIADQSMIFSSVINNQVDNYTKIIASFIPDEIIIDPLNYNDRINEVAVVVGRITGLQALYEKSHAIGKGGASTVTQTLNTYISNIMQEAFIYNGDVVKYTGNSFIIIWKQNNQAMADCVHQAIDFSLSVIKNYANLELESGVTIDVKLGVSSGSLLFAAIGTENVSTWVMSGKPMEDNEDMLARGNDNEVIINGSAWEHVNSIEYVFQLFDEENEYYLITDFSSAWRSIRDVPDRSGHEITAVSNSYTSLTQITIRRDMHDIYESRPCIGDAIKLKMYENLKRYVFPPVVKLVEANEPLENLIEMRHMVTLACNYVFEAQTYHDIIKLTDIFYRLIQNIIIPYKGYIVKLSFIENELSYFVLFGVRGETSEFDSRNALKAATKCFKGSELSTFVQCCSMTVVTGLLYCGIVGHSLRREFTILGPNIFKARRLFQEFTNKVTCDRETFLQSKLEPRNFMLQEFKQGGGTFDIGPVYEYLEFDLSNRLPKFYLNPNPILGRQFEIETFNKIIANCTATSMSREIKRFNNEYQPWGVFYTGEARIGKTRLIEELIAITPKDMPMFRLRLGSLDKQVAFQTIYFIFGVPLGIAENSTIADRETKLRSKLKQLPLDGIECLLNAVFRVNFPISGFFLSLNKKEKNEILRSLIKHLCRICFAKVWVIFIDGGEYIDNESWDLIYPILESLSVVLTVAIGNSVTLPKNAMEYLSWTKCKLVQLMPIHKLYQSALACQVMNCSAIPIELEKIICDKSNGNPGWIENFVLSLMHSNIIWLRKVTSFGSYKHKLIVPLKEHLTRKNTDINPQVQIRSSNTINPAIVLHQRKWDIYANVIKVVDQNAHSDSDSVEEEIFHVPVLKASRTSTRQRSANTQLRYESSTVSSGVSVHSKKTRGLSGSAMMVPASTGNDPALKGRDICLMVSRNKDWINSYDIEFLHEFNIAKVMDILTSFETSVIKAASVVGDLFLRDMVMYILTATDERAFATACQHLFEIGIFACAEGDFRQPIMNYTPMSSDHYKTFDDTIVQCNCIGYLINEFNRDLPRYANCGFMRFKSIDYRTAAYNLLTDVQLNELHTKALRFIEKHTRKCNSCGSGIFSTILGNPYKEGVLAERIRKRQGIQIGPIEEGKSTASILENWDLLSPGSNSSYSKTSIFRRGNRDLKRTESVGLFKPFMKAGVLGDKAKIPPTFEEFDFTCCECDRILRCMYFQIRMHYKVTQRYEKWLHATLEYSALCTKDKNVALSLICLNDALEVLDNLYQPTLKQGETWKHSVMKARILSEIGRARSEFGQIRLAYQAYEQALHHYGFSLPRTSSVRYKLMEFRQYLMLSMRSRRGIGTKYGYVAQFCDTVSNCLYMLASIFIRLEMWDNAYTASMCGLKKALESEKNFVTLMNAFARGIYICGRMTKYKVLDQLEIMSLDYCRRYRIGIDVNDANCITKLYAAIFYTRVQRARFEDALLIGMSLDSLTDMLHLRGLLIRIFPMFFEILLIRMESDTLYNALTTYEQVSNLAGDYVGEVWLYALATYFHLQTGYLYMDISKCEKYYYTQVKHLRTLKEPEAECRYFVAIWLWYIRTENYDIADVWERKLPQEWTINPNESINNMITTLMYIEGLILLVVHKMDRKVIFLLDKMYNKISNLISKMERLAIGMRLIAPRLYHLKAYYYMCRMQEYEAWDILDKAIKLGQTYENSYDTAWAKHSGRAWKQDMPAIEVTCWKDHANFDVFLFQETETTDSKMTFFTLELPMYM